MQVFVLFLCFAVIMSTCSAFWVSCMRLMTVSKHERGTFIPYVTHRRLEEVSPNSDSTFIVNAMTRAYGVFDTAGPPIHNVLHFPVENVSIVTPMWRSYVIVLSPFVSSVPVKLFGVLDTTPPCLVPSSATARAFNVTTLSSVKLTEDAELDVVDRSAHVPKISSMPMKAFKNIIGRFFVYFESSTHRVRVIRYTGAPTDTTSSNANAPPSGAQGTMDRGDLIKVRTDNVVLQTHSELPPGVSSFPAGPTHTKTVQLTFGSYTSADEVSAVLHTVRAQFESCGIHV